MDVAEPVLAIAAEEGARWDQVARPWSHKRTTSMQGLNSIETRRQLCHRLLEDPHAWRRLIVSRSLSVLYCPHTDTVSVISLPLVSTDMISSASPLKLSRRDITQNSRGGSPRSLLPSCSPVQRYPVSTLLSSFSHPASTSRWESCTSRTPGPCHRKVAQIQQRRHRKWHQHPIQSKGLLPCCGR